MKIGKNLLSETRSNVPHSHHVLRFQFFHSCLNVLNLSNVIFSDFSQICAIITRTYDCNITGVPDIARSVQYSTVLDCTAPHRN